MYKSPELITISGTATSTSEVIADGSHNVAVIFLARLEAGMPISDVAFRDGTNSKLPAGDFVGRETKSLSLLPCHIKFNQNITLVKDSDDPLSYLIIHGDF